MSAKLTKSIAALGLAALMGCEAVAGIHDLTYSAPPDEGGTTPGDDATSDGGPGSDVEGVGEATGDRTVPPPDAGEASSAGDAGDAMSEAGAESGMEGGVGEAGPDGAASDAIADGDAGINGPEVGAGDGEAGVVSYAVPIPGPDGGALTGSDGGALMGELIDDIDSENTPGWILIRNGRVGTWFTYDDGTAGGVVPASSAASATPGLIVGTIASHDGRTGNLAAHVTGNGLAAYAGMGFDLNAYNGVKVTYDASAYQGVTFWGRIGGATGTASVRFAMPDRNTSAAGGICTASDGSTAGCSDYFSKSVVLTPNWQQFTVYYNQLGQVGFGTPKPAALDAAHVYSCQFQMAPAAAFDIWIDDIYFIDK